MNVEKNLILFLNRSFTGQCRQEPPAEQNPAVLQPDRVARRGPHGNGHFEAQRAHQLHHRHHFVRRAGPGVHARLRDDRGQGKLQPQGRESVRGARVRL